MACVRSVVRDSDETGLVHAMNIPWKSAAVVGASSGIGEAIARDLGSAGCNVALVARRHAELQRIANAINAAAPEPRAHVFPSDVRDTAAAAPLLREIAKALGGLDLVVYASGVMPPVGSNQYPTADDIITIETNFTGAVAWLNAAAERFAVTRSGTIVGISSIAGERGRRTNPVYQATKAGLNVYLESLRTRLAGRGVTVVTVKPGYVRTPLIGDAPLPLPAISPEEASRQILAAAAAGKRVVFVPGWWRIVAAVLRAIPAPVLERLPIK